MNKVIELLKQRRIWVFIISAVMFILSLFGVKPEVDTDTLSGLIVSFIEPLSQAIIAGLAIWSFIKPKK